MKRKKPETTPETTQEVTPEVTPRDGASLVVDPTGLLLRQISGVESRVPWTALGLLMLCLLWLPGLAALDSEVALPAEISWIESALTPWEADSDVSAFSRKLTLSTWEWQGAEIESTQLTPPQWVKARLPSFAAGLVALLIFYFLARIIVGDAAALLAAALLAIADPWVDGGRSVLPLVLGEMLVLLGVVWALSLQARHREVELAGVNAIRIGLAGVFLGLGLLLAPAGVATLATTVLVWLLLGLRRSNSNATTLPVGQPAATTALAFLGTVGLLIGAALSMWAAERFLGGAPVSILSPLHNASSPDLWLGVYRAILSPGPMSDRLIVAAVVVITVVRAIEWTAARPWRAAGLLPWAFLGLWVLAVQNDALTTGHQLEVPMTVPPLFMLGAGWLLLRGLRPGVIRRQEYMFLIIWVLMGTLLIPFAGGSGEKGLLAASVVILPAMVLVAGRGARALWEAEEGVLAKISVLVIAYVPVLVFLLHSLNALVDAGIPVVGAAGMALQDTMPWIVLGAALLGILSEFTTVRPDVVLVRRNSGGGRGRGGRSRGGRAQGGRGHGGRSRGGRDGQQGRGGSGGRGRGGQEGRSGGGRTESAQGGESGRGSSGRGSRRRRGGRGRRGGGGQSARTA